MQQDEGFHEIQLSGKQLVFLCMATTVVSVLIFLCGVLVGRGVRAEKLAASAETPIATPAALPQELAEDVPAEPVPEPSQDTPPVADDLSYQDRLDTPKPAPESLKAEAAEASPSAESAPPPREREKERARAREKEKEKPTESSMPPPPPPTAAPAAAAAPAPAAVPSRSANFMVQVASLRDRGDAEAMVKRLAGKGYPAFVLEPAASGATPIFRVRIGGYATRGEAEAIGRRLEKEEQFQPWITR